MKLGTFVLGGLAGAAVVMMMRNQTMSAVSGGLGQMLKQRMGDMKESAIQTGMDVKFGGGVMSSANNRKKSGSRSGSTGQGGLDRVEHIAEKDPKVKHQVNEILEQNGQPQI